MFEHAGRAERLPERGGRGRGDIPRNFARADEPQLRHQHPAPRPAEELPACAALLRLWRSGTV